MNLLRVAQQKQDVNKLKANVRARSDYDKRAKNQTNIDKLCVRR